MKNRYILFLFILLFTVSLAFSAPTLEAAKQIDKEAIERDMMARSITVGEWTPSATDETDVAVTIGTGTSVSSIPSPYTDWYYSEISCALYTAAEIQAAGGGAGVISHLRWYVQAAKTFPARNGEIWLKQVAFATLPTQTYTQATSGATMVWSTTNLTEGSPAGAWKEFDIADFTWDGISNLQVLFATVRAGYSSSTGIFRMSTVLTGFHQYLAQDVTPMPTESSMISSTLRPNIQLELIMAPGLPTSPIPASGATNVATNPTLSWTAGANSSFFDVYFGTNPVPTTLVSDDQVGSSWVPPVLNPTTTYYWRVHAFNAQGNTLGPVWSFTTGAGAAPNAPTSGAIVSVTSNSITGSFLDNATNETGFPLFYSLDGVNYTYLSDLPANAGTGTVTFTIPTLNPNTRYWARVFATGAGGTSTGFASADAWTLANPASQIVLGTVGTTTVVISSIPTTDGNPTGTLYRVMVNPGVYVMSGANPLTQSAALWSNVTVGGLVSGANYNFQAVAVNGAGVEAPGPSVPVTTIDINTGGPDAFNYFYRTNFAPANPENPTYSWITPGGTTIPTATGWTSQDDGYYTTPIPFNFPFFWYGTTYTNMYLGSNGYITFDAGYGNIPYAGILSTSSPGAGMFFWGRDMHVGYTTPNTEIYVETFGTTPNMYTVVSYINFAQYAAAANRMDAQIIFYENGSVVVQYNNINPALPTGVVGIKALNGAGNMNLAYPDRPINGQAIRYFRVVNQPLFSTSPSPFAYGTRYLGSSPASQVLTVLNQGANLLNISNVVASNPNVTPGWTTQSNIANGSPVTMNVTWAPTSIGETPGSLTFTHDGSNGPTSIVNMTGTAATPLTLSPTTVAYGDRATGVPGTLNVTVGNLANQPITVSNVTTTNPTIVPGWTTSAVPAGGNMILPFTWTPATTGALSATGTVSVGALGVSGGLTFTGNAIAATLANPTFVPTSGEVGSFTSFTVNFSSTDPLVSFVDATITFNGSPYPMSVVSGSLPGTLVLGATNLPLAFVGVHNYSVLANYLYNAAPAQATIATTAGPTGTPAQQGGPDGGGYYYKTSNAPGGPVFNWIDISSSGTSTGLTGDDVTASIPLGTFTFPFYGATVSGSLIASSNGNLQIGATGSNTWSNSVLPTTSLNAGALCFLWDDLYLSGTDFFVKYQDFGTHFVVQWRGHHISSASTVLYNAQIVIYSNGDILFQYLNAADPAIFSATIGIQGAQSGTLFTQYGNATMQWPGNNFAIKFFQTPPAPPSDPTNLVITRSGSDYTLNWTASTGTLDGYKIYNNATGYFTPPTSGTLLATVGAGTTTFTDVGVTGVRYYRVTGFNSLSSTARDPNYGRPWPRDLGINRDVAK